MYSTVSLITAFGPRVIRYCLGSWNNLTVPTPNLNNIYLENKIPGNNYISFRLSVM